MTTYFLTGIPLSEGIVIGTAVVVSRVMISEYNKKINPATQQDEVVRFYRAREKAVRELKDQQQSAALGKVQADVLMAHLLMLEDQIMADKVISLIGSSCSAEWAVEQVIAEIASQFEKMDDEYMRERSQDVKDVGHRLLRSITGQTNTVVELKDESIVIADDLMPSDTALMNFTMVTGFVTAKGGKTSHTAIMARAKGIAAVAGAGEQVLAITNGDLLIVDGCSGTVIVNPGQRELEDYRKRKADFQKSRGRLYDLREAESKTLDGRSIEIAANIGKLEEINPILEVNADGIGLFRTEFLFMDRVWLPDEEEQFLAYKSVLEALPGKRVIIRTLDAGGDKELCYLNLQEEENPALGFRAIRICLARRDMFKIQLRALLRAGQHGNLHIMFPMISDIEELREAKQLVRVVEKELDDEGVGYARSLPIGIMIEIPSAALMAGSLASEADFFSIGTNDLTQYTLAVDRMNTQVSHLNDYLHPAVLKLISVTAQAAKQAGIYLGMCGEMAGDRLAAPLLIGLGFDELSMNGSSILPIKKIVRSFSCEEAVKHANEVLALTSVDEVRRCCLEFIDQHDRS